jgi:hypothetical protein
VEVLLERPLDLVLAVAAIEEVYGLSSKPQYLQPPLEFFHNLIGVDLTLSLEIIF